MKVIINVYDVQPSCNQKGADFFGVGIYHSGIEINGQEWSFGGNTMVRTTGVYPTYPRENANFYYKTSVDLGDIPAKEFIQAEADRRSKLPAQSSPSRAAPNSSRSLNYYVDIMPVIEELKDKYRAYTYHMLCNNCNHFSDELLRRLFVNHRSLPGYVNRAAWFGSFFASVVPFRYVTVGTPEGKEAEVEARVKGWLLEDRKVEKERAQREKTSSSMTGVTLEELSTRETEMSI